MTDLALVNANVLTMDPDRPRASAVAITGGRIEALDASLDSRTRLAGWWTCAARPCCPGSTTRTTT